MQSHDQQAMVARALAAARVRALRMGLLDLHKTALDAERRRYERLHGRIESPQAALRLVLDDPWFQWLHPLAELIVQIDQQLADDGDVAVTDAEAVLDRVRGLLQGDAGPVEFRTAYHQLLQDAPDVVVAHGRVAALFTSDPK